MKILKKAVGILAIPVLCVTTALSVIGSPVAKKAVADEDTQTAIIVTTNDDGKTFSVDNESIATYYNNYTPGYSKNFYGSDEYHTTPVTLEWEKGNGKYYQVYISDDKHFVNAEKYQTVTPSLTIENIKPNGKYYWKVKTTDANGVQTFSDVYTFTPTAHVRTMNIDGVENMRDLGGLSTSYGKKIRYGIIYRSANLDSVTEEGLEQIKRLGIRTDLDLRGFSSSLSPLGENVKRFNFNAPYYVNEKDGADLSCGLDGTDAYKQEFAKAIKVCSDPNNYPIDFHCAIGRDRTGTLATMLYAISGVSEKDIKREYELSWFSKCCANNTLIITSAINKLCAFIGNQSGATFKEKASNYLLSIGVTQAEIDSVRNILTGITPISDDYAVTDLPEEPGDGDDLPVFADGNFSYTGEKTELNVYDGSIVVNMTESEAQTAEVPVGYTGSVLKLTPTDSTSSPYQFDMVVDFSSLKLNRSSIDGVSVRVYICSTSKDNAKYPVVRIPTHDKNDWILLPGSATPTDCWTTITLTAEQIDKLCAYGGGCLAKFDLALRANAQTTMYIDEITVAKKALSDNRPPVITTTIDNIKTTVGTFPANDVFCITDDSGSFDATYRWSNGSLDGRGRLVKGSHEYTVTATDACGNIATKKVTYIVEEEPVTALYKITFKSGIGEDITVTYADGESKESITPEVPYKKYYDGEWQDFTLEKTENQIVNAVYTPIIYTVTFKADGKVVSVADYTVENTNIIVPKVPEKEGFAGEWSEYKLNGGDKIVKAVYTAVTPEPNPPEPEPEPPKTDKKGCKSSVGAIGVTAVLFSSVAVCSLKKRKEK